MTYIVRLCLAFMAVIWGLSDGEDPCNAKRLPYMTQRVNGYVLGLLEAPICDYFLEKGWYSLVEPYRLASIQNGRWCGTGFGWFVNDTLPTSTDGNITVCKGIPEVNDTLQCGLSNTVLVKLCADGHYVYYLNPTTGCSEAFCIENPESVEGSPINLTAPVLDQAVKPNINVEVRQVTKEVTELVFYCNISKINTDYFYTIEWSLTTGLSLAKLLLSVGPKKYMNESDLLLKTSLSERDLRNSDVTTMGFSIVCSVKALNDPAGYESNAIQSERKFCGIQVLNPYVRIPEPNLPVRVGLKLSVPFGCPSWVPYCTLGVMLYIPKQPQSCQLSKLAEFRQETPCRIFFKQSDVNVEKYINFTGVLSENILEQLQSYVVQLVTIPQSSHLSFQNYQLDPIKIDLIGNKGSLNGKLCYAHSDPHVRSFDGQNYEHQYKGQYTMYRNKKYAAEVQIKTDHCLANSNTKPYCNCGVAVRVGRDVVSFDNCNKFKISNIGFKLCDDKILQRRVKMEKGSKVFYVNMPSGTKVTLSVYSGYGHMDFFEVDIEPSLGDLKQTEGLCGVFDNNATNDGDSNIERWRVSAGEDLFNEETYITLQSWGSTDALCSCEHEQQQHLTTHDIFNSVCKPLSAGTITCNFDSRKDVDNAMCSLARRRRSSSLDHRELKRIDKYLSVETSFTPKNKSPSYRIRQERSLYNNETARSECLRAMNTSIFQLCSTFPDIAENVYVDNCVSDVMLTNSLAWANVHLEGLRMKCIRYIEVNQPLTEESLNELENLKQSVHNFTHIFNGTSDDKSSGISTTSSTSTHQTNPIVEPRITQEILDKIKNISCFNECSGRGRCSEGTCICDANFTNFDCSVDATKPPQMLGIPDRGLCDTRIRACANTAVFARNTADSESLTCRLVSFKVTGNGTVVNNTILETKAVMESFVEVSCPLHKDERSRRAPFESEINFIASGYYVSVSNDGMLFSEEDPIVIFDAKCVNCSKSEGNISCKIKSGFCLHDEICYEHGESTSCYLCEVDSSGFYIWADVQDCTPVTSQKTEENTSSKLWIIGAVLGPIGFTVLLVAVFIRYYLSKRSKKIKLISRFTFIKRTQDGQSMCDKPEQQ